MLTRDKTVEFAEFTCRRQRCNSTNSAAFLRMEIKHVAAYYFLRTIKVRVDLRGLYAKVYETWHYVYSNHLCLTIFSELEYSAAFGRESRKFAGGV